MSGAYDSAAHVARLEVEIIDLVAALDAERELRQVALSMMREAHVALRRQEATIVHLREELRRYTSVMAVAA